MSASDILSLYGAALATLLAIVQVHQWRKNREIFAVQIYDEFYQGWESDIELTVTNLTDKVIEVRTIWFGVGYRPWFKPWKRTHSGAFGMSSVNDDGVGNQLYLEKVPPGQIISAYIDKSMVQNAKSDYKLKLGFDCRPCVWIEHSLGGRDICKALEKPKN
jgi:hypothetical protein